MYKIESAKASTNKVSGITDYTVMYPVVKSSADEEFKVIGLNNNILKINTLYPNAYRSLDQKLNAKKVQWFIYGH